VSFDAATLRRGTRARDHTPPQLLMLVMLLCMTNLMNKKVIN